MKQFQILLDLNINRKEALKITLVPEIMSPTAQSDVLDKGVGFKKRKFN